MILESESISSRFFCLSRTGSRVRLDSYSGGSGWRYVRTRITALVQGKDPPSLDAVIRILSLWKNNLQWMFGNFSLNFGTFSLHVFEIILFLWCTHRRVRLIANNFNLKPIFLQYWRSIENISIVKPMLRMIMAFHCKYFQC